VTEQRRGADRRLTFTQNPYTSEYAQELAEQTGLAKGALYNRAMEIMAILLRNHRLGVEYMVRDNRSGRTHPDIALSVLLGDVLTSLRDRDAQD
jgi:hypothetical protein